MHERILHPYSSEFSESLVGAPICAVRLPRCGTLTEVLLQCRGRGNLYFVISSLQVLGGPNHVVGDGVGVDAPCNCLGIRVRRGVDHL